MNKLVSVVLVVALVMPQTARPVSNDFVVKCACAVAALVAVSWYTAVRSIDSDKEHREPSAGMGIVEREALGIGGAAILGALGYVVIKAVMGQYTPQSRLSYVQGVRNNLELQALTHRTPQELAQRHLGMYPLVSTYFEVQRAYLAAENALSEIDMALQDEPENISLLEHKAFLNKELAALGQLSSNVVNTPEYAAQRSLQIEEEKLRVRRAQLDEARIARYRAEQANYEARVTRREAERARYVYWLCTTGHC